MASQSTAPPAMEMDDDDDRFSALSDDLLRHILYFVPFKEAASTSVLARRWGSLWRSSGAVNLAVQVYDYRTERSYEEREEAEDAFFSQQEAFVQAAKAALDAAEARITRLTLRVESDNIDSTSQFLCEGRDWRRARETDVVGAAVSHHAAHRVEELRVAVVAVPDWHPYPEREIERPKGIYGLVSLPAETLRVLDLTRCDLRQSSAPGATLLPRLATLRLVLCSVERKLLQALLNAAPELSTVHLDSLFVFDVPQKATGFPEHDGSTTAETPVLRLSFQAVTTLVLALCGLCVQDSQGHRGNSWAIDIDAPMLQSFRYKGLMRPFILRRPCKVARVDLHFLESNPNPRRQYESADDNEDETTPVLFWQFVHNFTSARTLRLKVENDLTDVAAIGKARRARLLCAFANVERLELEGTHRPKSKTVAVAIANLLHCCPALGELMLKLSNAPAGSDKDTQYGREFLERKYRLDYNRSIDSFVRRRSKAAMTISMDDSIFGDKYDDVPVIPGLSGRSFACLQRTLRRVSLQFRLDSSISGCCLGVRLIKFFADEARVLEEMRVDNGNRRLYEHLNFNVERRIAPIPPISAKASVEHKDLAESSSEFSEIPSASLDSTTDIVRSTIGITLLPLQRQTIGIKFA